MPQQSSGNLLTVTGNIARSQGASHRRVLGSLVSAVLARIREFVQAVCTFCCLSVTDMLKFCFMVYDKDRSGLMEMEELHHFIKVSVLENIKTRLRLGIDP